MKQVRKLASVLLALVMALALTATAFAEGETGSITINDAVVGQTYSAATKNPVKTLGQD